MSTWAMGIAAPARTPPRATSPPAAPSRALDLRRGQRRVSSNRLNLRRVGRDRRRDRAERLWFSLAQSGAAAIDQVSAVNFQERLVQAAGAATVATITASAPFAGTVHPGRVVPATATAQSFDQGSQKGN